MLNGVSLRTISPPRVGLSKDRFIADVLITDVKLPGGIDGWLIAERCREDDPKLPVIDATCFSPVAPRAGG